LRRNQPWVPLGQEGQEGQEGQVGEEGEKGEEGEEEEQGLTPTFVITVLRRYCLLSFSVVLLAHFSYSHLHFFSWRCAGVAGKMAMS